MPDRIAPPLARRLRDGDWNRLATFACSAGEWYADDVERFVRANMRERVDWGQSGRDTVVVLLVSATDENDIIAVGAHEIDDQITGTGIEVEGSYLLVAAVRSDMQGTIIDMGPLDADGRPVTVGRWLMQVLVDDLPDRAGAVRALVARENTRSLRLCDRIGLTHESDDPNDERFVARIGRLG